MVKKRNEHFQKRIAGLFIGLIGIFLLLFAIFYTVSRVFRPQDIATMLPSDSTISLVQININPGHEQVSRFYNTLNKYTVYHPNSIRTMINEKFETDFENEVKPWINRQVGFALIEGQDDDGAFDTVLFIETKDLGTTREFMESRGLESQEEYLLTDNYKGVEIFRYSLSQSYKFIFLHKYLILAENQSALERVIDAEKDSKLRLVEDPNYQKVAQNLPITTLAFGYTNIEKLIKVLKSDDQFMSEKGRELLAFEPFLRIYKSFGFTSIMEGDNMAIQTYTVLNGEYLQGRDLLNFELKFRANYLGFIDKDVKFYAGGLNLRKQLQRFSEIFSVGGEVSYLIFEGAIRELKNEYFGEQVDLEEDLYPLLQNEYLLAVTGEGDTQATTIILGLKDPIRDKEKISLIAESFVRKSAILAPKVVEIELEDGTIAKEIQAEPFEITKGEEEHRGYAISVLKIGNEPWGVYYLILDDQLVISTTKASIKKTIELFIDSADSFKSTDLNRDSIQPVIRTSDEVMFVDLDYMFENLVDVVPEEYKPFVEPFKYVSVGKNYFKDGISTINYLTIE